MNRLKNRIASSLGNIIEWYDFALYGFFAPLIATLYFPSSSIDTALLKAFSVFAIGFFARPIGALLFGYIGDTYGRSVSLKITPLLITFPTLLLSILPTYHSIGILAPIALIFLRIWQGICIGGEYANNIIYLCESTEQKHIYFWGSLGSCSSSFGIFLASTVAAGCYTLFTHSSLESIGWRLAFGLSSILGLITFFMRKNMQETHVFQNVHRKNKTIKNPILISCRYQWRKYLLALGLTVLPAVAFNYSFVFLPSFLSTSFQIYAGDTLDSNSISLLARLFIIPIIGLIADKIGGIAVSRLSCVLFIILSYPLLMGIMNDFTNGKVIYYAFTLLTVLNAGSTPGLLIELLAPETRSTILSFTLNISFGMIGGVVPLACFLINDEFGSTMASVYFLILAAFITLIATFFFKRDNYG
jgi:MHS family proline/betaine transporter-like MFS transporter